MPTNAKDATTDKMYKMLKLRRDGYVNNDNTWIVRSKVSAAKYINRLEMRLNSCNGRQVYMISEFRRDPSLILFTSYTRGIDTFSGKYETSMKLLIPEDYALREIKWKPGYVTASSKEREARRKQPARVETHVPPDTDMQPFDDIETRSEKGSQTDQHGDPPTVSPFGALTATPLTSSDGLQGAVDEVIRETFDTSD